MAKRIEIMKADGHPVCFGDILIEGDFIITDAKDGNVLFDTAIDGCDVPPDISIRPVSWMYSHGKTLNISIVLTCEEEKGE